MSNQRIDKLKPTLDAKKPALNSSACAQDIRLAREESKISQKALAIEMGITQGYLCDLELARRAWSLELFIDAKESMQRLVELDGQS